jgi:geranylgeranyl reductase family protein
MHPTSEPDLSSPALPRAPLPAACEVLVVGAGPAGSACATWLARAGLDVVLVDQHDFPRDKVCGDGLIPDAHAALARLGVLDAVMAQAQPISHVRCVAPRGGQVDVAGRLAVLPRRILDHLLVRHAQASGARLHTPVKFEGLIEDGGRVVGARLRVAGADALHELRAGWVVLATGATMPAMLGAGLCERRSPSGVALRAHVRNPALAGVQNTMDVVWHRALSPGYGWIFPCGNDVYNIGVGAFFDRDGPNLRHMFDAFTRVHAPAQALMQGGEWVSELKGAPLRCTLSGAQTGRPGLLATGEAIGSTYDFTGEGIGKALETGLMAAEALLAGRSQGSAAAQSDAQTLADYDARLAALKPRFSLYARANHINRYPWLADLVIWRAQRSRSLRRSMSGLLNETSNPGHLLSLRGMLKLFKA